MLVEGESANTIINGIPVAIERTIVSKTPIIIVLNGLFFIF